GSFLETGSQRVDHDLIASLEERAHFLGFFCLVESETADCHLRSIPALGVQIDDRPHGLERLHEWESLRRLHGSERQHPLRIETQDPVLDRTFIAQHPILAIVCLPVSATRRSIAVWATIQLSIPSFVVNAAHTWPTDASIVVSWTRGAMLGLPASA